MAHAWPRVLDRKHAVDVRLVLLDRAMPGVPGDALLRALREIRADARVLLISGYSESRLASELADESLAGFLQKPFLPEGLIEKVRALLV